MSEPIPVLRGCSPEPLASYLKALGVLRLVAEQKDPGVTGWWEGEHFRLQSSLTREDLIAFFLKEYRPTPIIAPWNGASGFWDRTTAHKALEAIAGSTSPRLEEYRTAIGRAKEIIVLLAIRSKPDKEQKPQLLRACRVHMPDAAVKWLDAAYQLTNETAKYPPLLGTGGNDGKLDFTSNFMQNIQQAMPFVEGADSDGGHAAESNLSRKRLDKALFGEEDVPLADAAVGQFNPGGVGGPNALQGFEGSSLVNPWDFVLMIEGSLLFTGSTAWRLSGNRRRQTTFPFTVRTSAAGWGSLVETTGDAARSEVWLPMWDKPASFAELSLLFSEGRAQIGPRQAQTGVDFARALASLGVDRGIKSFQRYGFLRRSGKAYLAAPLGRLPVREQPAVGLLEEIDPWLSSFRRQATDKNATAVMRLTLRRIEDAIFRYCLHGGTRNIQDVLVALGHAELTLARNKSMQTKVRPLQGMSTRWLEACHDGSAEFALAAALASINDPAAGPIRANLEPVTRAKGRWSWDAGRREAVWSDVNLSRNLAAILERRCLSMDRQGLRHLPIQGGLRASLGDIQRYLAGKVDEDRLTGLLWGLSTLTWRVIPHSCTRARVSPCDEVSRAYCLLKLLFLPDGIPGSDKTDRILVRPEPAVLNRLRSEDVTQAVAVARRRLMAHGFVPLGSDDARFIVASSEKTRLAAALLLPIADPHLLVKSVIRPNPERVS